MSDKIVPFGKYKGRDIDEVIDADPAYLQWLAAQDWFRANYVTLHQTIINRGAEPEETPDHNALQVLFLDDAFCLKFCRALGRFDDEVRSYLEKSQQSQLAVIAERMTKAIDTMRHYQERVSIEGATWAQRNLEEAKKIVARATEIQDHLMVPIGTIDIKFERNFECAGVDVALNVSAESGDSHHKALFEMNLGRGDLGYYDSHTYWISLWQRSYRIEIKPTVSDDYPAVLRQMKRTHSGVLFLKDYAGQGATQEQFIKTFNITNLQVVFLKDCK